MNNIPVRCYAIYEFRGQVCFAQARKSHHPADCRIAIPPDCHTAGLPYRRIAIPPDCHTAGLPFRRTAIPPDCHTAGLPYRRTAIPPDCHTAGLPYRRTAVPPLGHSARRTVQLGVTRSSLERRWRPTAPSALFETDNTPVRCYSWFKRSCRKSVVPGCAKRSSKPPRLGVTKLSRFLRQSAGTKPSVSESSKTHQVKRARTSTGCDTGP